MKSKSSCNPEPPAPAIRLLRARLVAFTSLCLVTGSSLAWAGGDAPAWMHAAANAPVPAHDEKVDAVLLYSEKNVNVISADKIKVQFREVYKILRPSGKRHGTVAVAFNPTRKITSLHGWCIPAQGKDYEVKEKDAFETSLMQVDGGELYSDVKDKVIQIPAADPGNVVGYEFEREEKPTFLQDYWDFQSDLPTHESHYSFQLPAGWEYKAAWLNYAEVKPTQSGNRTDWVISDVPGIKPETAMPPIDGLVGEMLVYFFPSGGGGDKRSLASWKEMGQWYTALTVNRRDPSPEIQKQVAAITAGQPSQLEKMQAIALWMQRNIRYVAISLGIGGLQPHPAPEVFTHRYGDCKDKATLMSAMLHEIGIDSYYVIINHERDAVTPDMPAHNGFDHAILAVRLPDNIQSPTLIATVKHPTLGRLLFFDPTNEITPFGEIGGYLQANFGLLVTPDGGDLVQLPKEPIAMNGIQRDAKLTLDSNGTLQGQVTETRLGDRANDERGRLRSVTKDTDQIKPIEDLLSGSLSLFRITKASVRNLHQNDQPFGFDYTFEAQHYAKNTGGLVLVRPRVLGVKSQGFLETKEPRKYAIEFDEGPWHDADSFEITIPAGYVVDDVPPPVDAEFSFASYHSRTEVKGNLIQYRRTLEVKDLSVPVAKAEELRKFYRIIAGDERNTVVLKAGAQ